MMFMIKLKDFMLLSLKMEGFLPEFYRITSKNTEYGKTPCFRNSFLLEKIVSLIIGNFGASPRDERRLKFTGLHDDRRTNQPLGHL